MRDNIWRRHYQMNKKFLALTATTAIAVSGFGSVSALAATEQPVGNPVVIAGTAPASTSYADALAAYNTALAAYNTAAADTTATKATVQTAFNNARNAYANLLRSILTARATIDQTFRDAIKTATDAYRTARKAATTAQAKIDADNAYQVAVAAASSARDVEYAKYPAPTAPAPMPVIANPSKGGNGPGDKPGKGGKKG
jgi:hypothetical protein